MLRDKRLLTIFALVFSNLLGAGVILPLLPLYAEGEFGASPIQVTLLASAYFGAQFIASPYLGRLSDKYGRRPVLIASQFGTLLSFGLFIAAIPIGRSLDAAGLSFGLSGGLLMLYVARILDGLTGGNLTTAQAYASDISSEDDRAQALGFVSGGISLGFIFGPVFGGILVQYGNTAPFVGAAVIIGLTLILTLFLLKESLAPEDREKAALEPRSGLFSTSKFSLLESNTVRLIIIIGFVTTLAFSAVTSTFSIFAADVLFPQNLSPEITARNIGFLFSSFGITGVVTQIFLLKPVLRLMSERRAVVVGQTLAATTMFALGLSISPLMAVAVLVPFAFGRSITEPSLQAILTRFGNAQVQGRLLGIYQSALSLGFILGPVWGGYTYQLISPRSTYILSSVGLAVAAVLGVLLSRHALPARNIAPSMSGD